VVVIICDERLYGDISLDDIIEKTKAFARASETVIKVQAVGDQS
jgi:hypothetical protein